MNKELLRLSPPVRYALQGLVHLAQQPENAFCLVGQSASRHQLPKDFLAKIFQKLANQGLLLSRRGPGGGYALARRPEEIYLSEVLTCIEGPLQNGPRPCALSERPCDSLQPCIIHDSVMQATQILVDALEHLTLADVVKGDWHAAH